MNLKFNSNFWISAAILIIFTGATRIILKDFGDLPMVMLVYTILFLIPAAFYLKDTTDYFLAAAISIVPFIFWFKAHNPYSIKTPIFFLFLIPVILSIIKNRRKLNFSIFDIIILAPIPLLLILTAFSPAQGEKFSEFGIHLGAFFTIYISSLFIIDKNKIGNFLIFCGTVISLWGILQWFGLDPFIPIPGYDSFNPSNRILGTLGNANFFSGYLIGIFAYSFMRMVLKPCRLIAATTATMFLAILISGTRGVVAAFFIASILWLVIQPGKRKIALFLMIILLIGVALVPSTRKRFMVLPRQIIKKEGSMGQRELMWKSALSMIKGKPAGAGPAGFRLLYPQFQAKYLDDPALNMLSTHARHPHNQILEWAATGGPLMMMWYLFIIIFMGLFFFKDRDSRARFPVVFALIVMLIHNMVSVVLNYEHALSVFAVLLALFSSSIRKDNLKADAKVLVVILILLLPSFLISYRKFLGSYHFSRGVGLLNLYNVSPDQRILGDAEKAFSKTLKLDPAFVNGWYRMGNLYTLLFKSRPGNRKYLEQAAFFLNEADLRPPHYYETRYNLGLTLISLGKLDEADNALRRSIDIEPWTINANKQWCELFIGRHKNGFEMEERREAEERLSRLEETIRINEKGLSGIGVKKRSGLETQLDAAKNYLWTQRGFLNFIWGNYDRALTFFQTAYRLPNASEQERKHALNNILAIAKAKKEPALLKEWILTYRKDLPRSAEAYLEEAIFRIIFTREPNGIKMLKRMVDDASSQEVKNRIFLIMLNNSIGNMISKVGGPEELSLISESLYTGQSKESEKKKFPQYKEFINGFEEDPWKDRRITGNN